MIYLQLFLSFFKIGLFGFGGGLAILSLIEMEVEQYGWMTQQEFVDIVAVSQVTPGPIGINCATYVGYTVAGIWGSVLSTCAIVLYAKRISGYRSVFRGIRILSRHYVCCDSRSSVS